MVEYPVNTKARVEIAQPNDPTIKYIPLTRGKFAIVDAADYLTLIQWPWKAHPCSKRSERTFYATRTRRRIGEGDGPKTISMHSAIMDPDYGCLVDHIDGDGLNNTRKNLRIVTKQQNSFNRRIPKNNTSGVSGVAWRESCHSYYVGIRVNGKQLHLGTTKDHAEAVRIRKEAEMRYFGEYRNQ